MTLTIQPVTFRQACAFVAEMHRHNKPPRGHKFSIGCFDDDRMVGVAMIGRPVARALDDGLTAEVNRTCTDGHRNANSMLYGAAMRACKAMGYLRVLTYTQEDETGASLKAVGFIRDKELEARKSWAESSVALAPMRDPIGNGGVARVRWVVNFGAQA